MKTTTLRLSAIRWKPEARIADLIEARGLLGGSYAVFTGWVWMPTHEKTA